jgi:hypothetical protein
VTGTLWKGTSLGWTAAVILSETARTALSSCHLADITGSLATSNGGSTVTTIKAGALVGGAGNVIGGVTAAARNVISGNRSDSLYLLGQSNTVQGNFIGTKSSDWG